MRTLRRRAYKELEEAVDNAGKELSVDWVLEHDRDLDVLRNSGDPAWRRLEHRHRRQKDAETLGMPEPARGDRRLRANLLISATALGLVATAALVLPNPASWIADAAVAFAALVLSNADAWWVAVVTAAFVALALFAYREFRAAERADRLAIEARRDSAEKSADESPK